MNTQKTPPRSEIVWESVSKKTYWDRTVAVNDWRIGVKAGHRSYLPDAIIWMTAREFIFFYGIEPFKADWPRLRALLPQTALKKSGTYDIAWSYLYSGGWNLKPTPDFFSMPERRRAFLVAACKAPGLNIYAIGKSLGMQYRRAHDHAKTLIAQGKLRGDGITEAGRTKIKLYPAYQRRS